MQAFFSAHHNLFDSFENCFAVPFLMHGTCDPVFHVPKLHRHADRNASVQGVQLQLVCIACLFALKFSNPLCT